LSAQPDTRPNVVSLMVSVGDISADKHTARLMEQLKLVRPELHIWGLGSINMRASGAEILFDCQEFSSIGIISVLKYIPFLARVRQTLLAEIEKRRPAGVLLVDFGGFNLVLAQAIRARFKTLPIYYFISPQIWGSRPWRINTIARTISKMFVIFPFEESIYAKKNIPVTFVGHPLTKNLPASSAMLSRDEFASKYDLNPKQTIIAIFAGSRKSEIKNLFPVTLAAVRRLSKLRPEIQFAVSQANTKLIANIENVLKKAHGTHLQQQIKLISPQDTYSLMSVCDLAWAKSGTTTLELTLFAKPMLIFYRGDWFSYLIFLAFKRTQRVGWPNLLAGKELIPELIQLDCSPDKLIEYSQDLLDVPGLRREIISELTVLRNKLGEGDYARTCAEELAEQLVEK
jgi:lipid-A-disaccharide synthase